MMGDAGYVRRVRLRTCLIAAGTLALAAGSGSAAAAKSASHGSSKSPIWFATMAPVNTPLGNFGGIWAAVKAGAAAVNKTGGINGHPVRILTCNSESQAAAELNCARTMVASKAVAVIGDSNGVASYTTYGQILANGDIADVANSGPLPNGYVGNNTFPISWGLGTFLPCFSHTMAVKAGGNKVALVLSDNPTVQLLVPIWQNMMAAQGLKVVKTITVPQTASDYSSYVGDVEQSGANIAMMALIPGAQAFVAASGAVNANYSICTSFGIAGAGTYTGPSANKLYIGNDTEPVTANVPGVKAFLAQMAAEKARGDSNASTGPNFLQGGTLDAWLGFQVAAKAASEIRGPISRASFLKAIRKVSISFGGMAPPINFTSRPAGGKGSSVQLLSLYAHVWSSPAYLWKWQPSKQSYTLAGSFTNTFQQAVLARR